MGLPDGPDFPAYRMSAGNVRAALAEYTVEGISEVMEVYDLALDMETQLDEDRAWNTDNPAAAEGSRRDAGYGRGDPRYALLLRDISCTFISRDNPGQRYTAVAGTTLKVAPGEFVSVVGPTGCGKSTLLNIGAGLIEPSSGSVAVYGEKLAGINRRAGYMFQADALMPWKSALDNVIVGLLFRGVDPAVARERSIAWLTRVGLSGFEDRYPHQLSGGMRKRVAMAQTLILDPDIILMDEPFSALDVQTRQLMENELLELWSEKKKAVLFITHDLDEAIALSDRVVVLSSGPATHPIGEFPIDLPRPRDVAEIRHQPRFTELHTRIWDVLRDEVLKGYIQHKNVAEE
jgi:NitT/TauT family transport system ATP-binding protein